MKPSPRIQLYKLAVKLVGKRFTKKEIIPEAQHLLMDTFLTCAETAGQSVKVKITFPKPRKKAA